MSVLGAADDDSVVDGGVLFNEICVTVTPLRQGLGDTVHQADPGDVTLQGGDRQLPLRRHLGADAGNDLQLGYLHLERRQPGRCR